MYDWQKPLALYQAVRQKPFGTISGGSRNLERGVQPLAHEVQPKVFGIRKVRNLPELQ